MKKLFNVCALMILGSFLGMALHADDFLDTSLNTTIDKKLVRLSNSASLNPVVLGDLPVLFGDYNKKAELADGEKYALYGEVIFISGWSYFKVDLKRHPWLANDQRVKNPYYPLNQAYGEWSHLVGRGVVLQATAHGKVITDANGGYSFQMTLDPVVVPTLASALPQSPVQHPKKTKNNCKN